jgi:hypothetical protein
LRQNETARESGPFLFFRMLIWRFLNHAGCEACGSGVEISGRCPARTTGIGATVTATWALAELRQFAHLTGTFYPNGSLYRRNVGEEGDIVAAAQVAEHILDRVLPDWRSTVPVGAPAYWEQHNEATLRVIVAIERREELETNLVDNAPKLSAGSMHPWIWDAARSLWQSGHLRQAVTAAAVKVKRGSPEQDGAT